MEKVDKSDIERLKRIRTHCANIKKILQGLTFEEFKSESGVDVRDACAFRIFQAGEHSNKLSKDFKMKYNNFDWRAVYYFRNILGHDYESVNFKRIWNSCKNDIPKLLNYVDKIISDIESPQKQPKQPKTDQENHPENDNPEG